MKLSLTAIAALFAATLHSSVATGTRAASSNVNTNAAEDKLDRDLEGDLPTINLGNIADAVSGVLGDLDETMDEAIDETAEVLITKATGILFLKMIVAHQMSTCIAWSFGTDIGDGIRAVPMSWVVNMAGPMAAYLGDLELWDANQDTHLVASEMTAGFAMLSSEGLIKFAGAMESTCAGVHKS